MRSRHSIRAVLLGIVLLAALGTTATTMDPPPTEAHGPTGAFQGDGQSRSISLTEWSISLPIDLDALSLGQRAGDGASQGTDGASTKQPSSQPPIVAPHLGAVLVAALLIAILGTILGVRLLRASDRQHAPSPDATEHDAGQQAAGDTADRRQSTASPENDIYRAWYEMAQTTDVANPAVSTPDEFAQAAIDAGLPRNDVRTLTRLFERVRYGGSDPTPEREQAAITILRQIEDTSEESSP